MSPQSLAVGFITSVSQLDLLSPERLGDLLPAMWLSSSRVALSGETQAPGSHRAQNTWAPAPALPQQRSADAFGTFEAPHHEDRE